MEKTAMENLEAKISLVLERYSWIKEENNSIKEENSTLKSELTELKMLLETKEKELLSIKENDELKDLELDEMAERIEKIVEESNKAVEEQHAHGKSKLNPF